MPDPGEPAGTAVPPLPHEPAVNALLVEALMQLVDEKYRGELSRLWRRIERLEAAGRAQAAELAALRNSLAGRRFVRRRVGPRQLPPRA